MKGKKRYLLALPVALLLALVAVLTAFAVGERQTSLPSLDYSFAGNANDRTISAAELFLSLFAESPTAEEIAYLNTLQVLTLTYTGAIPDSHILTHYARESGTLTLTVKSPYTYTATNGCRVEWIPISANVDGQTILFSEDGNGGYTALQSGLSHQHDFDITVDYTWQVSLPAVAVDALLTMPHQAATEANGRLTDYETRLAEWQAADARYQAYKAFLEARAAHEQYLLDKADYGQKVLEYTEYQRLMAQQKLYDDWKHFFDYQEFKENRLEDFNRYQSYQNQVKLVTDRLAVLETMFITDSHGWQTYASLMGGTVTEVLNRKDELMVAQVPKDVIETAGDATEKLRPLMEGYATLRNAEYESEHARITALYAYYTQNFTQLREQFSRLYGALHTLYDNEFVGMKLSSEGKSEHYRQFVGVLYVVRAGLDDNLKRNDSLKIGKFTLTDVVEEVNLVPDKIADPAAASMPEVEVPYVEEVPEIAEPTEDQPQTRPDPPFMPEPQEPAVVAAPGDPPPAAEHPGNAPTPPDMSDAERGLVTALREGRLPQRTAQGVGKALTLSTTVERTVSNKITVTFYSHDGSVLERRILEYGDTLTFATAPQKPSDEHYHYSFTAWVTRPDNIPPALTATQDLSLYPLYRSTVREYTVTWVLNDEERTESYLYGETPVSPFVTSKEPTADRVFVFSGWDREIVPVSGDVKYTATVTEQPRRYTVTWIVAGREEQVELPFGETPVYEGSTDKAPDTHAYRFFAWSPVPAPVTGDATYIANYQKIPLATAPDGTLMQMTHSDNAVTVKASVPTLDIREAAHFAKSMGRKLTVEWEKLSVTIEGEQLNALCVSNCRRLSLTESADGAALAFAYLNSSGRRLDLSIAATVVPRKNDAGLSYGVRLMQSDGTWAKIPAEGTVATGAFSVHISNTYGITLMPVDNCNLSQMPISAQVGDSISLRLGCTFGYRVASARVTMANGSEVTVNPDLTFLMPEGDVTVELTVVRTVYHVTFTSDGKVLTEADYFLGDTVIPPADPTKESDEEYDYTFGGWSKEVTIAIGDDLTPIYDAVFIATPRSAVDPFRQPKPFNWLLYVIMPACLLVAIALPTVFILLKRKKKKTTLTEQPTEQPIPEQPAPQPEEEPTEGPKAEEKQESNIEV